MFLKIPACLYNSTMHSDAFFISLLKHESRRSGRRAEGARVFFYFKDPEKYKLLNLLFHFQLNGKTER